MTNSTELQFPGTCVHGCYFHFSQCLWRKVQSFGLVEEYEEDGSGNLYKRMELLLLRHPILLRMD